MKNKVPCFCLFIQGVCKLFFMIAMCIMTENAFLATTIAMSCLSDIILLYWMSDVLDSENIKRKEGNNNETVD